MKVLYIVGWGRSGTTILANALDQVPGFFSAGEATALWQGVLSGFPCGCGLPVRDCDIWSGVLRRISGDSSPLFEADEIVRVQRHVTRERYLLRLLAHLRGLPIQWPELDSYLRIASRMYHAIAEISGCRVVVDSSKVPTGAAILTMLDDIEPYFVHMVRDPRGTAFSWQRRRIQPKGTGHASMPLIGPVTSTTRWLARNLEVEALCRMSGHHKCLLVRYEDFVSRPFETLRKIIALTGETEAALPVITRGTLFLATNHTVAGNPARFHRGPVPFRVDDEWQRAQSPYQRLAITTIASPLLRRYGYNFILESN